MEFVSEEPTSGLHPFVCSGHGLDGRRRVYRKDLDVRGLGAIQAVRTSRRVGGTDSWILQRSCADLGARFLASDRASRTQAGLLLDGPILCGQSPGVYRDGCSCLGEGTLRRRLEHSPRLSWPLSRRPEWSQSHEPQLLKRQCCGAERLLPLSGCHAATDRLRGHRVHPLLRHASGRPTSP